jgi:hypothetical protein
MERIQSLSQNIKDLTEDAIRIDKGQKAAGTRVRKALREAQHEIKAIIKDSNAAKNQ